MLKQSMAAMADETGDAGAENAPSPVVTLGGKEYPAMADGEYDAVVLGTGLKECILAGVLSHERKKVLQIDRNNYYGGACASLPLDDVFKKFRFTRPEESALRGEGLPGGAYGSDDWRHSTHGYLPPNMELCHLRVVMIMIRTNSGLTGVVPTGTI